MTTAEISAKLCDWGSIRNPMALRSLGKVIQALGFPQYRVGRERTRGYVVYVNQDLDNQRKTKAREACEVNRPNDDVGHETNADMIF